MHSDSIIAFVRKVFNQPEGFIALHEPYFAGNEKKYLLDVIDSTYVSSVGPYVTKFEKMMSEITGAAHVIATTNGTVALHLALMVAGVQHEDEVITQPLTFVATANAIRHAGAIPVFVDVDKDTMGLSPYKLKAFLDEYATINNEGICINKSTKRRIVACVPMHTFGLAARIEEIVEICNAYNIAVVEDAAESLGSYYKTKHTGTFGTVGTFSFNGNKTVTCGGGGAIVTNDDAIAKIAKHLSTTAKLPHPWEFVHDEVAYNYRMPNLNAALACAQLEQLDTFIENKRDLADMYASFFEGSEVAVVRESEYTRSNYWLNAVIFPGHAEQQQFLQESNSQKIMTRPIWKLMNKLPMYAACQTDALENANWLEERVVNLPSSVRFK